MRRDIDIYYLEMTSPDDLLPARPPREELEVRQARIPSPELSRFLYTAVGGDWFWIDRLRWTYDQWLAWVDRPELETWIGYVQGTPAGYFELERQPGGDVELAYFGLLPRFLGRGLGGALLTAAVERAWRTGASRVWVHTCSLDGPASLANYQARGFRLYRQETVAKDLPDEAPGPWPGARASG
ncbi:MAG TPA: GNAT family N-acetyltransferase [Thermoanaerobaculia bacterium]|jgi:GNAT superfamily N-acetyltransferase